MKSFKKTTLLLFLTFFLFINQCIAVITVDVDTFEIEGAKVPKGVRVVQYDTNKKQFSHIDYYKFSNIENITYTILTSITLNKECNLTIPQNFQLKNYIIRTSGQINNEGNIGHKKTILNKHLIYENDNAIIKGGEDIQKILNKKHKNKENLILRFMSKNKCLKSNKNLSRLSENENTHNKERGNLGELATELTMLSYGYNRLPSKYEQNYGFDGVFIDSSQEDSEIFITESKCRDEFYAPKYYMKDCLSENKIYKTLKTMKTKDQSIQKTGEKIKDFLPQNSAKIFKFAHKIESSGQAQCLVEKFNLGEYKKGLPPVEKSKEEKFLDIMKEWETEEDFFIYFLKNSNIEKTKTANIINENK